MVQNHKNKISNEEIKRLFESNKTLGEAAVELNTTSLSLLRKARKIGLKWSDKKINRPYYRIELKDILDGKHPEYQTFKLKKKLLEENVKENKCEICGISEWNGKPLNIQLDHIDGNPHNHLLENLQMICPNCHTQTETYSGKNKNKGL